MMNEAIMMSEVIIMNEAAKKQGMGLYVHIPFCLSRCHYCSFASSAGLGRNWQERYKKGLLQEWQLYRQHWGNAGGYNGPGASAALAEDENQGRPQDWAQDWSQDWARNWDTIYFGGGTPTYLEEDILAEILAGLPVAAEKVKADVRRPAVGAKTKASQGAAKAMPARPGAVAAGQPGVAAAGKPGAAAAGKPGAAVVCQPGAAVVCQPGVAPREFTVEANPGTLSEGKLALLRKAGCNRLSMGAQSFDDQYLAWLGRGHRAADFRRAWEMARQAGFRNMSLDLIYGLPGQSLDHWRQTLEQALAFLPEHISLYQLNIEEETVLARRAAAGETCLADEETCRRQYLLAHEVLTRAGFSHYEISNYALPGKESRHNSLYWRNGYYLGLGAGAAGYLPAGAMAGTGAGNSKGGEARAAAGEGAGAGAGSATDLILGAGIGTVRAQSSRGLRYTNEADLANYLSAVEQGRLPLAEKEAITPSLGRQEELMLAFRLQQGVEPEAFRQRWGLDLWQAYGPLLEQHLAAGWLQEAAGRLRPTIEGWLAYNYWVQDYF